MEQFTLAMAGVEKKVYEDNRTNEEEVRTATEFFAQDEDVINVISKLKMLYNAVSGQHHPDDIKLPEHITADFVVKVMIDVR